MQSFKREIVRGSTKSEERRSDLSTSAIKSAAEHRPEKHPSVLFSGLFLLFQADRTIQDYPQLQK